MRRAARAIDESDVGAASSAIGRAQAIINELNVTLDMVAGGEIAQNLRDIYLFVNRHLTTALAEQTAVPVHESIGLITELRDAWSQAMNLGAAAA